MLVSVHIPRTGGRALRYAVLEPTFGARFLPDYGDKPLANRWRAKWRALSYRPSPRLPSAYDCVHGHFVAVKYRNHSISPRFAVWLRDPVQWALSRFHFGKRRETGYVTPEMTIWEFCESKRFQNPFAAHLWRLDLDMFEFIGICEQWPTDIKRFGRTFDIPIPASIQAINANPNKKPLEPYVVDSKLAEKIRLTNRLDVEIYERAKSLKASRFEMNL